MSSFPTKTTQVFLAARPKGEVTPQDFGFREVDLDPQAPVLLKILLISVDPYLRIELREEGFAGHPSKPVGSPMVSLCVAEVINSRSADPTFARGNLLRGYFPWQEYFSATEEKLYQCRVELASKEISLESNISLGITIRTAYFGLLDVGRPKAGETVVVTAAAGATGLMVCQIAKMKGCRVVGIAGGHEKCEFLRKELGVDAAIDYKQPAAQFNEALKEALSRGCDLHFDNVGGSISDAIYPLLNEKGRVIVCGVISGYQSDTVQTGPRHENEILQKRLRVEGFMLTADFGKRFAEADRVLVPYLAEKKLKDYHHVLNGLQNLPQAFMSMLKGANIGKTMVKL